MTCYLLVNSTFSKICIILDSFLDEKLILPIGTNVLTLGLSTAFGALGKFLGVFMSGAKKRLIIYSFWLNAICFLGCLLCKNYYIYIFFRTTQGFVAGLQNSLVIGLIGTLPDHKNGFANYTTISSGLTFLTGILLYFVDPLSILWSFIFLNFFSGLFFFTTNVINDSKLSMKEIDWQTMKNLTNNRDFIIKTFFLGMFMGCALLAIGQQKNIIMNVFEIKIDGLANLLCSITFLASSITSFFSSVHSVYLFNIMNFITVWCIFIGLATKSLFIFLAGIFLPFSSFSVISPIIMNEVTLTSSNRFISSAFANFLRSIATAAIFIIIPKISNFSLEIAIIIGFTIGLFYTFLYGQTK